MAKRDYYETLGVDRNADDAEIKKAYRRLAMQYHPDRNPGDATAEESFKEAKEAFEILSDGQKRAAYNQFGHAGVDPSASGGAGFGGAAGFGDIFDTVFGDIFGGGARAAAIGPIVARICAMTSNYRLRMRSPDQRSKFACRPWLTVIPARARDRGAGADRIHAAPAAAPVRYACNRGFSRSNKRARSVAAPAR